MRVLFYNWADPHDAEGRGGGVSIYQRNLIDGLAARGGFETAFLSAGLVYDLRNRAPRIEQISTGPNPRYTLVNAGPVAPAHADFGGAAQLDHPATEAAFADFIERSGPWDVIHFNNLEGLPAQVLALRSRWPETRFVLSLHNYYPICPQVNLWHQERQSCDGFDKGARCVTCLPATANPRSVRLAYAVGTALARIGAGPQSLAYQKLFRPALGLAWRLARWLMRWRHRQTPASPEPPDGSLFKQRRARMVALINHNCDAVICVSKRVQQIAEQHGIAADKLQTLYIGTREADAWQRTTPRATFTQPDGTLRLAYLGYMRRDKGFYFLMQALLGLPHDLAARLHLTVAARNGDAEALRLLSELAPRLASLRHIDGYTHDGLDDLLEDVDLGVVPVLWEDNLPQVSIEMHARHIPLLTSDLGGAQEMGNCPDLQFRAGDTADFARALTRVLAGEVTQAQYWAKAMPPVTMAAHLDALTALYRETLHTRDPAPPAGKRRRRNSA
ncbi:glycosyltransferase [Pararhodobacter oceanensis]|uniref:glycosyltransferase n=1 Tax=Pararhodobacter oceanensis TaxID=2172121 RepID=UPI003A919DCC